MGGNCGTKFGLSMLMGKVGLNCIHFSVRFSETASYMNFDSTDDKNGLFNIKCDDITLQNKLPVLTDHDN